MRRFLLLLTMLVAFAAPLGAQTQAADASLTVSITASLTLANTTGVAFGSVFASAGTIATSGSNHARWDGSSDIGNQLSITFTLPAGLTRVGGGGTGPVPFACGNLAARFDNGSSGSDFDPALGLSGAGNASGPFFVTLGIGPEVSRSCTVNVSSRSPGDYVGLATLTVSVL